MQRQIKNGGNFLLNPAGCPPTQDILDRSCGQRAHLLERLQRPELLSQRALDVFSVQRLGQVLSRATGESRLEDKTSPMRDCQ